MLSIVSNTMAPMSPWIMNFGGNMSDRHSATGKSISRCSSIGGPLCNFSMLLTLNCSPLHGISLFLPSIIAQLGYSGPHAQLLTVPVYVCACLVCILMAYLSDRAERRGVFIFGLLLLALVGFIIAMTAKQPGAKYAGVFIAASGTCCLDSEAYEKVSIRDSPMWSPGWQTMLLETINALPAWQCNCN